MRVVYTLLCVAVLCSAVLGGWVPFTSVPDVSMDIAPLGERSACIVGGYSNTPMGVYCSIDNSFTSFTRMELVNPSFMFMALSIAPNGAAATGGIGFQFLNSSSVMYSHNLSAGDALHPSSASNEIISQDIKFFKTGEPRPERTTFAVVGDFDAFGRTNDREQGVIISSDGGRSFNRTINWHPDLSLLTSVRYGDYPDFHTAYVTAGHWPRNSQQELEDVNNRCLRVSRHVCHYQPHLSAEEIRQANQRVYGKNSLLGRDGYYGVITRTTDGGETWDILFEDTTMYFNDISCSTPTNCVAVGEGDDAYIYATQDGRNWSRVYELKSLYMSSLFRVRFATPTVAYAAGGFVTDERELTGIILKSTDAGRTWAIDASLKGVGIFFGLNFNENGTIGFAVGATNQNTSIMMRYEE